MESSSLKCKDIEVKIESEKMVFENIVKPKVEIKTEEDIKIKLESNDEDLL